MEFDNTSQEIWEEMQAGTPFGDSPLNFFEPLRTGSNFELAVIDGSIPIVGYYTDGLDQDELIREILTARYEKRNIPDFYFKKYVGKKTTFTISDEYGTADWIFHAETHIDSRNDDPNDDLKTFETRINTKIGGTLETKPSFRIEANSNMGYATCFFEFNYAEGTKISKEDEYITINREDKTTGETSRKKRIRAIEFKTLKFSDFEALCKKFDVDMEDYVIEVFGKVYQTLTTAELRQLNNFYEQVPIQFLNTLSSEQLFRDFTRLLQYDKINWNIDNSNSIIKALTIIVSKEKGTAFLYQKFNSNPKLIKEVYYYLDNNQKSQETNNQDVPNKTIFASMLMVICNENAQGYAEERLHLDTVFRIKDDYWVDSNLIMSNDKSDEVFDLTQEALKYRTVRRHIGGFEGGSNELDHVTKQEGYEARGKTHYLHPLDMVTLIIGGDKDSDFRIVVPAIFVKDMAYHREWEEVEKMIRIGIDIFVIIVSVATLVAGPGSLIGALSWLDLGIAAADVTFQSFEKEIRKLDGGPEFLDAWEKIYLVGGLVTSIPLVGVVLKNGSKLLYKVSSIEFRSQLTGMLKHTLKSVKNFPVYAKGQFQIITDFARAFGAHNVAKMQQLANEGVLFIKGIKEGDIASLYSLVYKGILIKSGDFKSFIRDASELVKKGKGRLGRLLDELYFTNAGTGGYFKYLTETPSLRMVGQDQPMSCAAACIRQMAKENGKTITEEVARRAAKTKGFTSGTDFENIAPALREILGKEVFSGTPDIAGIGGNMQKTARVLSASIKRPWIAVLVPYKLPAHTVIVDNIVDDIVYIRDPWDTVKGFGAPNGVEATMNLKDFEQLWYGSNYSCIYILKSQ